MSLVVTVPQIRSEAGRTHLIVEALRPFQKRGRLSCSSSIIQLAATRYFFVGFRLNAVICCIISLFIYDSTKWNSEGLLRLLLQVSRPVVVQSIAQPFLGYVASSINIPNAI